MLHYLKICLVYPFCDTLDVSLIGENIMTLAQIADLMGWMLLINIVLLIIGYLKITVFKGFLKKVLDTLMGEQSDQVYATIPFL